VFNRSTGGRSLHLGGALAVLLATGAFAAGCGSSSDENASSSSGSSSGSSDTSAQLDQARQTTPSDFKGPTDPVKAPA
jgi:hypothetical protein